MEYYKNEEGMIAVLVSPGYGAGWSTWNQPELAYDKRVVEFWLSKKDDENFMRDIDSFARNITQEKTSEYFASIGYSAVYFGGFRDIEMEWVAPGQMFRIDEYDGSETLVSFDRLEYTVLE